MGVKRQNSEESQQGLAWAISVLGDHGKAVVASSGMSDSDVAEIDAAFNGEATTPISEKAKS